MRDAKMYRPSVGMMILNKENKIFMAKKTENIGTDLDCWQMPQGGIEEDENLEEAVARELMEETGIDIKAVEIIAKQDNNWIYYDIPEEIAYKVWQGKYIGQRQKWFLLKAKNDLVINLNVANEEKPEFYIHTWADFDKVKDFSIWFRHDVYQEVLNTFKPYIS
jgi:putative (di)nucleoside polyphosphate hydrolase